MLGVILVNNYVLAQFLGICPFLGVSKKLDSAVGMALAVTFVMVLATLATWPIQTFLLDRFGIGYMQTVVFILVIAALVQLVELALKRYMPPLYRSLGVYLPLITTNCAVLGVTVNNIDSSYGFIESLANLFRCRCRLPAGHGLIRRHQRKDGNCGYSGSAERCTFCSHRRFHTFRILHGIQRCR